MPIAEKTVIIGAPVSEVYERWTHFDRFNEFMHNVTSVEMRGERMSHWEVKGPLGTHVAFDAETTMLEPNTRIAWNSRDGGDVKTSGQVTFNELGTGQTEVHVVLKYDPPAGAAGDLVARVFSNPQKQLEEDLERFKQLAESNRMKATSS